MPADSSDLDAGLSLSRAESTGQVEQRRYKYNIDLQEVSHGRRSRSKSPQSLSELVLVGRFGSLALRFQLRHFTRKLGAAQFVLHLDARFVSDLCYGVNDGRTT